MINKLSQVIDDDACSCVVLDVIELLQQSCCSAEYAVARHRPQTAGSVLLVDHFQ